MKTEKKKIHALFAPKCAKVLNEKAKSLGCNKLAYGHHKDDLVDTMLLSLIFEGRFHTFSPVTYLDRMDITLIRPLMYVDEADIVGFQHNMTFRLLKAHVLRMDIQSVNTQKNWQIN